MSPLINTWGWPRDKAREANIEDSEISVKEKQTGHSGSVYTSDQILGSSYSKFDT